MEQRRKIVDSRTLSLLNAEAFGAGRTYIPHDIINAIAPFGVHVIDKYIAFEGWCNCYVLLCMDGNFHDPYETNIEIQLHDYNSLTHGMAIHDLEETK